MPRTSEVWARLRARARQWCLAEADRGSMLVETAVLLVLVMIPMLYLVGTLGRLQAGAYAVSAAAREAGRTFVASPDDATGQGAAHSAALLVMEAHGFTSADGGVNMACADSPCLTPGSTVRSDATLNVPLPLIPDFLAGAIPTSITLTSSHVEAVEAFRAP